MKRLLFLIPFAALTAANAPVVPGINAFTAASYKQLANGDSNLILSPFNIATALSMALAGADGQTAREMRSVLHIAPDSAYDASLGALLADLAKAGNGGGNELHTANGLWVQKGFAVKPAFESLLANQYHAALTPLDFTANPEAARSQINRWTEEQTRDRIKDLFPPGSFDGRTRLVLTSAIYFYGKWDRPFLTSRTQPAPFTRLTGPTTETNFMNQTAHFGYAATQSAQILEMRYAGTGIAFDVLLPKTPAGLPGLEKSLTPENLTGWLGEIKDANVQVSLPKFRAESAYSLRKALAAMGMPAAFADDADFSGIAAKRGLAISEVVHKAFIDVTEQGTEAAAATGIAVHTTSMRISEPPVVFRADHPFLFLVRDTGSGAILFIGRLMNPR